jgi:hypothetical protein
VGVGAAACSSGSFLAADDTLSNAATDEMGAECLYSVGSTFYLFLAADIAGNSTSDLSGSTTARPGFDENVDGFSVWDSLTPIELNSPVFWVSAANVSMNEQQLQFTYDVDIGTGGALYYILKKGVPG